eukprot:TRINITY_DN22_c0_g1_i1.p1 TRINITY_DN22_c0_g1~~TRINITY_DN22_c0_g1_i1.p1  ORF type:complete len:408 (-),score=153.42 TRINITY_DN22_c0_g1_i1:118-1254(-)
MGCTGSKAKEEVGQEQQAEQAQSKAVDAFLAKEENLMGLTFKVLLLGAGESGKSTVVKQLKLINKVKMDEIEIENYATNIHKNAVQCMQIFVDAAANLGIEFEDAADQAKADAVCDFAFTSDVKRIPVDIGESIDYLWKHPVIQKAYAHRSEFWFIDTSQYYFENVLRFVEDGYVPTEEDCIMTRIRTTGISVTELDEGDLHFKLVDVGGQRNERKKWIHCFDDVKALLFVVNLAGYDQVMFEDPTQNRMQESLSLFGQICNDAAFDGAPIFLFLNKKDIFEQMIRTTTMTKCFPTYTGGGDDVQAAIDFITLQFRNKLQDQNKEFHAFDIAARSRRDVKDSWASVKQILRNTNKDDVERAKKNLKDTSGASTSAQLT